ncbi:hypothetical protein [Thalassotalea mangrovi]|uniref:Uncharacterized protein n=1 Tax=Thalassotalea mangrovi TaxID=2572245 RepID=A0A4U1B688_9GAMM|nr:hypothetical protein [Thalassotalea mangrovi]TKB45928.1 hypothetical protein E8M12_06690 [Thalassotalea mangrovi]
MFKTQNSLFRLMEILITGSLLSLSVSANTDAHQQHNLMGIHGMVLLTDSEQNLYANHLPLYRAPHNHQIVYLIGIPEKIKPNVTSMLANDQMITLVPEPFDLTRMITGESFAVNADIYQGHFERGGNKLLSTTLTLSKQVLNHPIDANRSESGMTIYVTPINERESLYVHKMDHQPGFDALGFMTDKNLTNSSGESTIECEAPKDIEHQTILLALKNCGLNAPDYLETQDFQ